MDETSNLIGILYRMSLGDALWLRDWLVAHLEVLAARGDALGYMNAEDDKVLADVLAALFHTP